MLVTIIVPIRDEAANIRRTLAGLAEQDAIGPEAQRGAHEVAHGDAGVLPQDRGDRAEVDAERHPGAGAALPAARVDRPSDLARADTAEDPIARRWLHHVAGDSRIALVVTLRPFDAWSVPLPIAQHGQPSDLDTHVPLILWGRGIQHGTYDKRANTVDIAPTLAQLLGL